MVVATGFFDGVHLGHRHVLSTLVGAARERGTESIVATFWPHPRTVLQDEARGLRLLSSLDEKKALLAAAGVDRVEVIPFSRAFSEMTAEAYLREYVIGRLGATAIVVGYDNRLGSDRCTPDRIRETGERLGLEVLVADPSPARTADGVPVSSTQVRGALAAGRVEAAADMLGYRYPLRGVVVEGNRLGRTIGFPTANMQLFEPRKMVPADGVYYVAVETLGRCLDGMCNIGVRPTVGAASGRTIETHVFDFDESIYGLDFQVSFLRRIRDERKFASMDDLRARLAADREECLRFRFRDV